MNIFSFRKITLWFVQSSDVLMHSLIHMLWEGHKILRNLHAEIGVMHNFQKKVVLLNWIHRRFDQCYIGKIYGGDFAKIVAFAEYMNFFGLSSNFQNPLNPSSNYFCLIISNLWERLFFENYASLQFLKNFLFRYVSCPIFVGIWYFW